MSSKTAPDAHFYTSADAFIPSGVSAVSAWLRVANATSDVNGISSVPDALNTNPAVQSVDARKPVIENSANGLPCMRFATNDVLAWPITAQSSGTNYAGYGVWLKPDAVLGQQTFVRISAGTNGASGYKLSLLTSGTTLAPSVSSVGASAGRKSYNTASVLSTSWQFITIEYNKDAATDADRLIVTANGVSATGTVSGTDDISAGLFAATGNILFGNVNDGVASGPLNGLIGPNIYAFSSKMPGAEFGLLTTAARTALKNYQQPT